MLSKTPREHTAVAAIDCVVYYTTVDEFDRLKLRHVEFTEKIREQQQIQETYRKNRMEQLKEIDNQVKQKLFKSLYKKPVKENSFKLRNEVIAELSDLATKTSARTLKSEVESPTAVTMGQISSPRSPLLSPRNIPVSPSNNHLVSQYNTLASLKRLHSQPLQLTAMDSLQEMKSPSPTLSKQRSESPVFKDNFHVTDAYLTPRARQIAIRGASLALGESGKFAISDKRARITMSGMIDKKLEFQQSNMKGDSEGFIRLFTKEPKTHHSQSESSQFLLTGKVQANARANSTLQPLRPYENHEIQKLYKELKLRSGGSESFRLQTSPNADLSATKLLSSRSNDFGIKGISLPGKSDRLVSGSTGHSVFHELSVNERFSDTVDEANNTATDSLLKKPMTMTRTAYKTVRVNTDYDDISQEGFAELELAAPWRKRNNNPLKLSINCMKPHYFVQTPGATVRSHVVSNLLSKRKDSSNFGLNTGNNNNTTGESSSPVSRKPIQGLKTPRSILPSKHNLFRQKPSKPYLTEMHYLIEKPQSEYGFK